MSRPWSDIYEATFDGAHLRVRRRDGRPVRCGWDTLYQIKNAMAGTSARCVEVFPPHTDLVDEENMRHLFVVPDGVMPPGLHGWAEWAYREAHDRAVWRPE